MELVSAHAAGGDAEGHLSCRHRCPPAVPRTNRCEASASTRAAGNYAINYRGDCDETRRQRRGGPRWPPPGRQIEDSLALEVRCLRGRSLQRSTCAKLDLQETRRRGAPSGRLEDVRFDICTSLSFISHTVSHPRMF